MDILKLNKMNRRFNEILDEMALLKGQNTQFFTETSYAQMIEVIKTAKNKVSNKKPEDYQRLKRFDVTTVGEKEKLIVPSKEDNVIKFYVHRNEIFQILHGCHVTNGHGGRNKMAKEVHLHFKNITTEMISTFLSLCEQCKEKRCLQKQTLEGLPVMKKSNEMVKVAKVEYPVNEPRDTAKVPDADLGGSIDKNVSSAVEITDSSKYNSQPDCLRNQLFTVFRDRNSEDDESEKRLLYKEESFIKTDEDVEENLPKSSKKLKRKKRKRESSGSIQAEEEYEMPLPLFSTTDNTDDDSDRLFLLSFAPEMRQLPVHIKMWARAQIANIMQEAVSSQYNNTLPRSEPTYTKLEMHRINDSE